MTHPATYAGHVWHAIERAGSNRPKSRTLWWAPHARRRGRRERCPQIALRAGCPVTTAGITVNRSVLRDCRPSRSPPKVLAGEGEIYAAGGVESITCVQNEATTRMLTEQWVSSTSRNLLDMLQTAETVASDRHFAASPGRIRCAKPAARRRSLAVRTLRRRNRAVGDDHGGGRQGSGPSDRRVTLTADEGIRADTTYEGVAKISRRAGRRDRRRQCQPVLGRGLDVHRDGGERPRKRTSALGVLPRIPNAGREPDEMGIGPVFAVPKLLAKAG